MLVFFLLLVATQAFSPQYIDGPTDSAYTCNCILKDEYMPSTTTTTTTTSTTASPITEGLPLPPARADRLPARFWALYNSQFRRNQHSDILTSSFLDRVLAVFRRRTPAPAPFVEPQNDATGTALRGLGKTIFTKENLGREWNVLDRFTCKCQGELLDVLKAQNYLSLTILHD